MEPEQEPVAEAIGAAAQDGADALGDEFGGLQLARLQVPQADGAQLRQRVQQGRKYVGVTEDNTIRNRNNQPRVFDKKLHKTTQCGRLRNSESPLTGILEISLAPQGLCRCCHTQEELDAAT